MLLLPSGRQRETFILVRRAHNLPFVIKSTQINCVCYPEVEQLETNKRLMKKWLLFVQEEGSEGIVCSSTPNQLCTWLKSVEGKRGVLLVELKCVSVNGSDGVCQRLLHLPGLPLISTNGTRPGRGFCGSGGVLWSCRWCRQSWGSVEPERKCFMFNGIIFVQFNFPQWFDRQRKSMTLRKTPEQSDQTRWKMFCLQTWRFGLRGGAERFSRMIY